MDCANQESLTMTMKDWEQYYTSTVKDKLLNVISLEFSQSKLSSKVRAPAVVRQIDWIETSWPAELKSKQTSTSNNLKYMKYPKVQKYCLMSVGGCYTDWHIDFGGSSVWYHVLRGSKVFFLVPPSKVNLREFEKWSKEGQHQVFFGHRVDDCSMVTLNAGDTFLIPTGWIHAVYTPEDSLVFGGNFLHNFSIDGQLQISKLEGRLKVPNKYRFPFFQELAWYAAAEMHTRFQKRLDKDGNNKDRKSRALSLTRHEQSGLMELLMQLQIWAASPKFCQNIPNSLGKGEDLAAALAQLVEDPLMLHSDIEFEDLDGHARYEDEDDHADAYSDLDDHDQSLPQGNAFGSSMPLQIADSSVDGQFACPLCATIFQTRNSLGGHMPACNKRHRICGRCHYQFETAEMLETHKQTCKQRKTSKSPKARKSSKLPQQMIDGSIMYPCECGKMFPTQQGRAGHKRKCPVSLYVCGCGESFKTASIRIQHRQTCPDGKLSIRSAPRRYAMLKGTPKALEPFHANPELPAYQGIAPLHAPHHAPHQQAHAPQGYPHGRPTQLSGEELLRHKREVGHYSKLFLVRAAIRRNNPALSESEITSVAQRRWLTLPEDTKNKLRELFAEEQAQNQETERKTKYERGLGWRAPDGMVQLASQHRAKIMKAVQQNSFSRAGAGPAHPMTPYHAQTYATNTQGSAAHQRPHGNRFHWLGLAEPVWQRIFALLDRASLACCMRCCRTFRRYAEHPLLWDTIQISDEAIGSEAVQHIAKRHPRVLKLLWSGITDTQFDALLREMTQLKSLDLRGCQSLTNPLLSIACSGVRLNRLNVNFTRRLSDACTRYILVHRESLVELHLAQTDVTDEGLAYIMTLCQSLQELDIYNCAAITDNAFLHAGVTCPALQCLDLRGTRVTDKVLTILAPCVNLQVIQACRILSSLVQ